MRNTSTDGVGGADLGSEFEEVVGEDVLGLRVVALHEAELLVDGVLEPALLLQIQQMTRTHVHLQERQTIVTKSS